ncbi:MAG: acetolactate synthase small subunit [Butyricicoccus sp.]
MEKYILSVTVQNNAGVLARVSSLFGRRGYNIDSLTVSATTDPKVSCMSIIVQGDHMVLEQIMKQLKAGKCIDHIGSMTRYAASLSLPLHAQAFDERGNISAVRPVRGPHR